MKLGVKAYIYVPSISSPAKIARIRQYGAEIVVGGETYADLCGEPRLCHRARAA